VRDLTVGLEEELLVLDPQSFDLVSPPENVFTESPDGRFKRELSPSQVEVVTGVCGTPSQAVTELGVARARLIELLEGRRLAGLGTHPFAAPWDGISPGQRYADILHEQQLGARLGRLAAGLHIHVAVCGADRALAVYNALRGVAPLFVALAANAPFVAGFDSGLATVRPTLSDALPRQGVGPWFRSWGELEEYVGDGLRVGAFRDVSQLWWECRLNLRLGTIELRAPDSQMSLDDVHGLAALAHATVADFCARYDDGVPLDALKTRTIQENRWRAARFGLSGTLIDPDRRQMVPTRVLVGELIRQVERSSSHSDIAHGLQLAEARLERDVPAEQRDIVAQRGMRALAEWAADATEQSPGVELGATG
jgi:carboxylate-amine ligase